MCTSLTLKTDNEITLLARTMDFAIVLDGDLIVVPRGYPLSTLIDKAKRPTTYAFMGTGREFDTFLMVDGLNEKGLACATLYFPGYAHYSDAPLDNKTNLAPEEVIAWILSSFSSIDEVRNAVSELNIVNKINKFFGIVLPLHYIVTDQSGNTIVIEPMDDGIKIYDNPIGVMTNSPDFNWHMTNIRNYIGANPHGLHSINLNGVQFSSLGSGAGSFGLPGDYTPPSRFLRTVFAKETINPMANEEEGVKAAFHILASVDIPKGNVIAAEGVDYTQYTGCMVCQTGNYYFKTYDNNQIVKICLFDQDLDAKVVKVYHVDQKQVYGSLN